MVPRVRSTSGLPHPLALRLPAARAAGLAMGLGSARRKWKKRARQTQRPLPVWWCSERTVGRSAWRHPSRIAAGAAGAADRPLARTRNDATALCPIAMTARAADTDIFLLFPLKLVVVLKVALESRSRTAAPTRRVTEHHLHAPLAHGIHGDGASLSAVSAGGGGGGGGACLPPCE